MLSNARRHLYAGALLDRRQQTQRPLLPADDLVDFPVQIAQNVEHRRLPLEYLPQFSLAVRFEPVLRVRLLQLRVVLPVLFLFLLELTLVVLVLLAQFLLLVFRNFVH